MFLPSSRRRPAAARFLFGTALASLTACSPSEGRTVTTHADGESTPARSGPPLDVPSPRIEVSSTPYVAEAVTGGGTIAGTVQLDGAAPADSVVPAPEDLTRVCGATVAAGSVVTKGPLVAGVVVWLEGARRGKALPEVRRHEVAIDRCRLVPRAQAVPAGGTLHVHSLDRLHALVRFVRWPGGDTVSTITTNDEGEVVPDDHALDRVGLLEVRGAQPPWMRAWVLVFDHPYATTTDAAGAFTLGDVPPGSYRLVAWHERFGRVEQPVTVTAGQGVTAVLHLGASQQPPNADTAQRR
ncbi:MAG: carboxypeptidase regulatory-like domain-containing protein [Gemmatirosa sp.]|nr:carboxypeptidase regulatory-like domain-containing protein [Gemmatirosa sp.]